MGNKIVVFPELVSQLSCATNTSEALCESFLKNFFSLVSEQLEKGRSVDVKQIGVFSVVGGEPRFAPSAEVVSAINAAFECFEPVELDDEYDESEPEVPEEAVALENPEVDAAVAEAEPVEMPDEGKEDDICPAENSETVRELPEKVEDETPVISYFGEEGKEEDDDSFVRETSMPVVENGGRPWCFVWGLLTGLLVAAAAVCVMYFLDIVRLNCPAVSVGQVGLAEQLPAEQPAEPVAGEEERDTVGTPIEAEAETEIPQQKASEEQMFTVTKTAYLSNISRKYYGHYVFWIYIYLENRDVIEDPDNLPVGAVLKIPAPEKYGIDKDDPNSIKAAESKAFEVTGKS